VVTAAPIHARPIGYNGAADLDYWYTADATSIDPVTRAPLALLNGRIVNNLLTAGPATSPSRSR